MRISIIAILTNLRQSFSMALFFILSLFCTLSYSLDFQDNILGEKAYDKVLNMNEGEFVSVEFLKAGGINPYFKSLIDAHFKGKNKVSKKEVYGYVKTIFDTYATSVLSGKDFNTALRMSKSQKAKVLKNVAAAFGGDYTKPGQSSRTYFNPYQVDIEIVFMSFGRPDLNDQRALDMIKGLQSGPGYEPNGKYALRHLTDQEQKSLVNAALSKNLITHDKLLHATERMYAHIRSRYQRERVVNGRLKMVKNAILGGKDFNHLEVDSQRAIIGAVIQTLEPQLFDNEIYNSIVMNYYKNYMGNFHIWRTGEAVRDEQGRMIFDEKGKTVWGGAKAPITGTLRKGESFNATYGFGGFGGDDRTRLIHDYMRVYSYYMKKILGEDTFEYAIMMKTKNGKRYNYDQNYTEIARKINQKDPSGQKLQAVMDDARKMLYPSAYNRWMYMDIDYYGKIRKEKYIPQMTRRTP